MRLTIGEAPSVSEFKDRPIASHIREGDVVSLTFNITGLRQPRGRIVATSDHGVTLEMVPWPYVRQFNSSEWAPRSDQPVQGRARLPFEVRMYPWAAILFIERVRP